LRDAATLTGVPRRDLRARVQRGEIAVRLVGGGASPKLRLTAAALAEAGLLGDNVGIIPRGTLATPSAVPTIPELTALVDMVRAQGARISALEDQRFHLALQLGAAMERAHAMEGRVHALTAFTTPAAEQTEARGRVKSSTAGDAGDPHARQDSAGTTRRVDGNPLGEAPDAAVAVRHQDESDGAPRVAAGAPDRVAPRPDVATPPATAIHEDAFPRTPGSPDGTAAASDDRAIESPAPPAPSRAFQAGSALRRGAFRLLALGARAGTAR